MAKGISKYRINEQKIKRIIFDKTAGPGIHTTYIEHTDVWCRFLIYFHIQAQCSWATTSTVQLFMAWADVRDVWADVWAVSALCPCSMLFCCLFCLSSAVVAIFSFYFVPFHLVERSICLILSIFWLKFFFARPFYKCDRVTVLVFFFLSWAKWILFHFSVSLSHGKRHKILSCNWISYVYFNIQTHGFVVTTADTAAAAKTCSNQNRLSHIQFIFPFLSLSL